MAFRVDEGILYITPTGNEILLEYENVISIAKLNSNTEKDTLAFLTKS